MALVSATFAGVSNFSFKVAAKRHYNSSLFSFYGGLTSIVLITFALLVYSQAVVPVSSLKCLSLLAGIIASVTGILKVVALRHIDSTIYFPLFKLVAPLLAIVFGIVIFDETFSFHEWVGMVVSLFVPLLLITRAEHGRQNHLVKGLLLVLVTGLISSITAVVYKLVVDADVSVLVALWFSAFGIFIGSILSIAYTKGLFYIFKTLKEESSVGLITWGSLRSTLITVGFAAMLYAYTVGGTLAIVQTIHSLYILIPIVLAIVIYGEHWNLQKAVAIILSVTALALLG